MNENIEALRSRLAVVDEERTNLLRQIAHLSSSAQKVSSRNRASSKPEESVDNGPHVQSSAMSRDEKVTLFRSIFRGREDVYAVRFESKRTGRSG